MRGRAVGEGNVEAGRGARCEVTAQNESDRGTGTRLHDVCRVRLAARCIRQRECRVRRIENPALASSMY